MARSKSKVDILRSEQYFDDAVYSAFLNLHKAAKKKSEYIWSIEKFSSYDSIWGEPIEQESNVSDVTKKISENTNCESESSKQWHYGISNGQNLNQVHGIYKMEKKVMLDNPRKNGLQYQKVFVSQKSSPLQKFGDCNEKKEYESKNTNPIDEISGVNMPKQKNIHQILNASEPVKSRIKFEGLKRKPDVDCKNSSTGYAWSRDISQKKVSFPDLGILKTENQSQYSFRDVEKTSKLTTFGNCDFNAASNAEENKGVKTQSGETDYIKGKLSHLDQLQKDKSKRKRLLSSPVNILPLEDQKLHAIDYSSMRSAMSKTMLQLKIFKGDKVFDFTINHSDFDRMRKWFPKLQEVLPDIDGDEKEFNYSADAVKIVLGYLCYLRYPKPDERTAIEVLAACKSWEMHQFYDESVLELSNKLSTNEVLLAYGAAVHYGLKKVCDAYKCMLSGDVLSNNRPYRPRKCRISIITFIEPKEFCFPLKVSASTLHDNFNRDIRNEIRFKAIAGSYVITGFHILLNIDNENETNSANLEFFYVVRNFESSHEEELKVCKPLRRNIVIHLKRNFTVNQDETAEIVVESSIKPYLCFAIEEKDLSGTCDENKFCWKVTSTYKVANTSDKRFFIEKLLYYTKA